jgi:hypothetical protein
MGLFKAIKDSFTYSDLPEDLPAFVTVCQTRDNQIRQQCAEKAVQNKGSGIGFASPRLTPPPRTPEVAPAEMIGGDT